MESPCWKILIMIIIMIIRTQVDILLFTGMLTRRCSLWMLLEYEFMFPCADMCNWTITTTKQSITKPCAYSMGYTVGYTWCPSQMVSMQNGWTTGHWESVSPPYQWSQYIGWWVWKSFSWTYLINDCSTTIPHQNSSHSHLWLGANY